MLYYVHKNISTLRNEKNMKEMKKTERNDQREREREIYIDGDNMNVYIYIYGYTITPSPRSAMVSNEKKTEKKKLTIAS